ncbi:MAG TPA: putative sulfate/molybdate transporter [Pelomicrobium sp.]|nr:putative sulfate/molybdate transporter [Pelomicrobium sp.]
MNPPAASARDGSEAAPRFRFDRLELAGAFGDIGALIPFLVAYITLAGVDPTGMLVAFGLAMIFTGLWYRTPFPVQPMKAIGAAATTQVAHSVALTPGAIHAASLVTGIIWLVLAFTGLAQRLAVLMSPPIAKGIVLGLGISFMLDGARFVSEGWLLGAAGLGVALVLTRSRKLPAMLVLLLGGSAYAVAVDAELRAALAAAQFAWTWPRFQLGSVSWEQVIAGTLLLALPQLPLTLGNAVVAVVQQNNARFPGRTTSEKEVAASTGVINVAGSLIGGVPMCHGAGGLAGQVRFGARSGMAPVMLGALLLMLGLGLSGSVATLLQGFPVPLLGVVLFLAGTELALGSGVGEVQGNDMRFVTLSVAGLAAWNVGAAFVYGLVVHMALRRGWIRL